jgi:hypothetical protein
MTDAPETIYAWPHDNYRGWYAGGCSTEVNLGMSREMYNRQAKYTRTDISQARIADLELERDGWMVMVGKIAATIPAKDTIGATGTLGDMIKYLKSNQARIAELEARNGKLGDAVAYATQKFTHQELRIAQLEAALHEIRTALDYEVEYHHQGMGCGIEDRGITDRYEAMSFGWDSAEDRYNSEVIQCADEIACAALKAKP